MPDNDTYHIKEGTIPHTSDYLSGIPLIAVPERVKAEDESVVYGQRSTLNPEVISYDQPQNIARDTSYNSIIFSGLLVLLFIFYAIIIFRFRNYIPVLFKSLSLQNKNETGNKEHSIVFKQFVNSLNWLGISALLSVMLKIYLIATSSGFRFEGEPGVSYDRFVPLVFIAILISIALYRLTAHLAIAIVSKDVGTVKEIIWFNRLFMAICVIIFTPVAMTLEFIPNDFTTTTLIVISIPLCLTLIYYVIKSYGFFKSRKFSILPWILYLCGVEILPISFFVLLVLRDFEF